MTTGEENTVRVSTVHMREVGREIRLARKRSRIAANKVCDELGWSQAKLSKVENGIRRLSSWDVARLLGLCGANRETHDALQMLTGEADTGYFVRRHNPGTPEALAVVAMHERMATTITTYWPALIPSLVQSADYARRLLSATLTDAAELDVVVEARMARRDELLYGTKVPYVRLYLAEAALSGVVGDFAVMHDQLTALAMLAGRDNVTIRVIPAGIGHESLAHGGTYLELPKLPAVVYAEMDRVTVITDQSDLVASWQRKLRHLDEFALPKSKSLDLLLAWTAFYDQPLTSTPLPRSLAAASNLGDRPVG